MRSNTRKKIAPVVVGIAVVAALLPILLLMLGIIGVAGAAEDALLAVTLPVLGIYILAVGAVIVGVVAAMCQRLREIDGGEEDEAKKY